MKKLSLLILTALLIFVSSSCGDDKCTDCELSLFGIYSGEMVATETGSSPESITDSDISINITECEADCFEVIFQHQEGFTSTAGTFTKNGSIYSFDMLAIEDPADLGQPWSAENGVGTFDAENNNLRMTFEVSDNSGLFNTNNIAVVKATKD